MCRLRVQRHTEVAQTDRDAVEGKGHRAQRFVEFQTVVGRFRCRERRELVRCGPVEFARIHDHTTCDGAVARHVFGHRMHNERRAMFDRTAEIRGRRGVIDDHRNASRVCNRSNCVEVGDIAAGVCDGFAEYSAGVVVNSRLHCV